MSDMNRVQRWRQQQHEAGKDALTIWLPRELKLYVEDIALKRHCSPSDLIQQALTTCYPLSGDVTDTVTDTTVTDTSQIRSIFQQELRAFFAGRQPSQGRAPVHAITDTATDTIAHAESVAAASPETWNITDTVTVTVTDTVTDTHIQVQDVTAAVLETRLIPDTVTDTPSQTEDERVAIHALQGVTDTVTDTHAEPAPDITNTASDTEPVTDTVTVTGQALEPFDTTRYRLGKLCPRNHDYHGTGQSLRMNNKSGGCRACDVEQKRERRQAKRQQEVRA